jgi:sigma-54 dependent transcriptional regulator, flagellar regulatory protein
VINTDLDKEFPWAKFHSLDYPVRLDALATVLEDIRAAYSRTDRSNPRPLGDRLIGESVDTQLVRKLIGQVAPSLATVLITGESGTGKEVVARQIHELSGREGPFVAINCGAIPESLLESELFGHEKGAFTGAVSARAGRFEQANGGSFFLDEIGDMPAVMQVKLLRVLEERVIERVGGTKSVPVDVRLIAATHRDLPQRIETGKFREDLFYRLSVFPIEITRLSERPDDIPPLVEEFMHRMNVEQSTSIQFSDDAMAALQSYSWGGNVRELANLIERLVVIKPSGVIDRQDLPWPIVQRDETPAGLREVISHSLTPVGAGGIETLPNNGVDLKQHLADIEQDLIVQALTESNGVVQGAAELLGVGRTTLVEKIKRYDIDTSKSQSTS